MLEWTAFTLMCMFGIVCATVIWGIWRYIKAIDTRYEYEFSAYETSQWVELERGIISHGANGYEPESFTVSNETIYIMYRRELP